MKSSVQRVWSKTSHRYAVMDPHKRDESQFVQLVPSHIVHLTRSTAKMKFDQIEGFDLRVK